ncbi:hypothetical protein H5410_050560 [Solanum commersonii]|uniref:Uncharacterized protein n=1 Tax=Solanum commersonii TaxID=4109 RepID=A0A9J5WXE5_SOLCO|nr:hypothetical protein H5410_050560 [Solanum commersonii]
MKSPRNIGNESYKVPRHEGGGALAINIRAGETCSRASESRKKLGKKRSVSWPQKVDDFFFEIVTRSGFSVEKNREEAKLTRTERGAKTFFLYKNREEMKAPWERRKDSTTFS